MRGEALARRLRLIVIADVGAAGDRPLDRIVAAALEAGAGAVQLRAKRLAARETVELARTLRELTRRAGALFFVNDRVDVALVAGADGAHLGDDDLPLVAARRIVPEGFLLGRSVDTVADAQAAEREGADYLGLGPVYATPSKPGLPPAIGPDGVREVVAATRLPVVGIGGIDERGARDVVVAGAVGVAVIGAVVGAGDPGAATAALLKAAAAGRPG